MADGHPLWKLVRGDATVEEAIRAGAHDDVLPEVLEMAVRHAGPGILGACRDRLVRLGQAPAEPRAPLQPSEHPEVKPFSLKAKTKADRKGKG